MKRKSKSFLKPIVVFVFLIVVGNVFFDAQPAKAISYNSPLRSFAAPCTPGSGTLPVELFVPWYHYLPSEGSGKDCKPVLGDDWVKTISLIALAIVDMLMRLGALLAIVFVIWGGIQYIISQGNSSGVASAKATITNALVGLVITLLAIGIVQFIGGLAVAK